MRKILFITSLALFIVGLFGFVGAGLVALKIVDYNGELPIDDSVEGIVVDHQGNIYIALRTYGKIQVYDSVGNYLYNWSVDASGGAFNIEFDENQNILISTARNDMQLLYSLQGEVLSKNSIEGIYRETKKASDTFISINSEVFKIEKGLFTKVNKVLPTYKIIVSQPFYLYLMQISFAWGYSFIGVILSFLVLKWEKIKASVR
jgi:hypothetical protein